MSRRFRRCPGGSRGRANQRCGQRQRRDQDRSLDRFATKEDFERFATKDDLQRFATKDDLKDFATKDDLEPFVTKDYLELWGAKYATKEDLAKQNATMLRYALGIVALAVALTKVFDAIIGQSTWGRERSSRGCCNP